LQQSEIKSRVKAFIAENFLFREKGTEMSETDSLIESGVLDSTGVLELVAFLETDLGVDVADADIMPDNLGSVAAISAYVASKLGATV
jgi:acyl carrier protein